ncbi:MAG: hypothetical protein ACFE0Q_16580 [Anaerolineae bacterium]
MSDTLIQERIQEPVKQSIISDLYIFVPDIRKMYDEDGLQVSDFDGFGAIVRTLRGFIS